MKEIEPLRSEIDAIHVELTQLFRRRLVLTRKIWEIKKRHQWPFFDSNREDRLVHQFDNSIDDLAEQKIVQSFLKNILSETKKYLEETLK